MPQKELVVELREGFIDIFTVNYSCKLYQVVFDENSDSVIAKSYSICRFEPGQFLDLWNVAE